MAVYKCNNKGKPVPIIDKIPTKNLTRNTYDKNMPTLQRHAQYTNNLFRYIHTGSYISMEEQEETRFKWWAPLPVSPQS